MKKYELQNGWTYDDREIARISGGSGYESYKKDCPCSLETRIQLPFADIFSITFFVGSVQVAFRVLTLLTRWRGTKAQCLWNNQF